MNDFDEWGDMSDAKPVTFGPWPEGDYDAVCVESTKKTKPGTSNTYVSLKWQIDKDGKSRTVFQNITLRNASQEAMRIGKEQAGHTVLAIQSWRKSEYTGIPWFVGKKCKVHIKVEPKWNDPSVEVNAFDYAVMNRNPTQTHTAPAQDLGENDVF